LSRLEVIYLDRSYGKRIGNQFRQAELVEALLLNLLKKLSKTITPIWQLHL